MIVVDTSALMAVLLNEPDGDRCSEVLTRSERLLMSAVTLAEALIVASRRNLDAELTDLVEGLGVEIVSVTAPAAAAVARAYARWGKGAAPSALNFGDCFSYALAEAQACPLLYVGQDFSRTDIPSALDSAGGA